MPAASPTGTACLLALAALATPACGGQIEEGRARPSTGPRSDRPAVVLVTIDTLRADRLAPDGPMPHLRRLARSGATFRNAHAQVPLTLPSHTTILTGRGVQSHGVRDNVGYALDESVPTVAERFSSAGYATAAFVGGYPLVASFGLARGFDVYDDRMTRAPAGGRAGHTERRADEVVDAALAWIAARAGGPFFLWVHLFDPHDPYEAPAGFGDGDGRSYDAEIAFADHQLGRLIAGVKASVGARAWWVVTSDHGESLGEHGEATHGVFLYESTLRVPLVVAPPGAADGREVVTSASLVDLAPTLLDAAGLPSLPGAGGRSLVAEARGGGPGVPPAPLYLESIHGRRKYGWAPLAGYLEWPRKFIAAPRGELYDVARDPGEQSNLAADADLAELTARLRDLRGEPDADARRSVSARELARLAALGYVGPATTPVEREADDPTERPDPKERIAALVPLERGLAAIEAGEDDRARRDLAVALREDPGNPVALNNLGILCLADGELGRAVELFERGLVRSRGSEHLANNLGIARSRQGRHAEAVQAFRRALQGRPGFTAARFNLALSLHRLGRSDEALRELERVRREEPAFPELDRTIDGIRSNRR